MQHSIIRSRFFASFAALAVLAAACGGDGSNSPTGTTSTGSGASGGAGTGGMTTTVSSTSSSMLPPDCPGTEPANADKTVTVGKVSMQILDLEGNAPKEEDILIQVCGSDLCLYGKIDGQGNVLVDHGGKTLVDPALKYGGHGKYVYMGGKLPETTDVAFDTIHTVAFPDAGEPLVPGQTSASGGVTISLADDVEMDQEFAEPEGNFHAVVFKPTDGNFPALAAASVTFDLLVGLGPENTDICPAAKLSFPNSEGWTAGAEVELWLDGVKTFDHWVPYGTWAKVADAVVSDDGATISTKDGSGIPSLGVYGVRLKP